MSNFRDNSILIKQLAAQVGFDYCGISKAEFLEQEAPRLENWLKQNMQGEMHYMENHFDKRLNPTLLVDGAKIVISVLLNYFPQKKLIDDANYKISKYAWGEDYHDVLKAKLSEMVFLLKEKVGDFSFRIFVDSAPVMDKVWAAKSGLGWIGKHSNLINKKSGSFFFIGEIICDLEAEYDHAIKDYCGTCTRCIDACPTDAITESYIVDGSKCISYATIELKKEIAIPDSFKGKMDDWIFGCDICQDVCPWNRFSSPTKVLEFKNSKSFLQTKNEWEELTEEVYKKLAEKSPLKRVKFEGLKRNITFVKE